MKVFQKFIADRPALNLSALARELQIDEVNLRKIAAGLRNIPRHRRGDFLKIMKKYGYESDQLPY